MKRLACIACLCMSCVTGCILPPEMFKSPSVKASKNWFGATVEVSSDAAARGLKGEWDPATGTFKFEASELSTSASPVLNSMVPLYGQYQQGYGTYAQTMQQMNADNWAGANQLASSLGPIIGGAIAGQQAVQMSKVLRPNMIEDAAILIASQKVDPNAFLKLLDERFGAGTADEVRARLTIPNANADAAPAAGAPAAPPGPPPSE